MFRGKAFPIDKKNSISELFELEINGVKQWVYIRGEDQAKPILLMVHGGPGASQIGFIRHYQKKLEQQFVVVNWDQRGSGMSYSKIIPKGSMTIQHFVNDIIELSEYLCSRFNQDKIYMAAHSWGTVIGLLAVHQRPDLFRKYFGIAQLGNYLENEKASYHFLMRKAKSNRLVNAVRDLAKIGEPPWKQLRKERTLAKYLNLFGGGMSHDGKILKTMIKQVFHGTEYKVQDYYRFLAGQVFSKKALRKELRMINLEEMVKKVEVPIFFIMGKYDLTVPSQLTEKWFHSIEAKEKHWIWFENSAHSPMFEETEKFAQFLYDNQ